MIQTDIKPDGRIEGTVLMESQPSQLAIEIFAVFRARKVSIGHSPIGDRSRDAMNELSDAGFTLGRADLAIEVLIDHDVGCQLAPRDGNFAVVLFEQRITSIVFDFGGT